MLLKSELSVKICLVIRSIFCKTFPSKYFHIVTTRNMIEVEVSETLMP